MTNLLYVQTSGIESLERLYAPFILAQTAKATGIDASIFFLVPSLRDVIDGAIKSGVKFYACEQSTQLINLARGDFIPEAQIAGAGTLNDLVLEADGTMWF